MDSRKLTLSTMHSQPEPTGTLAYQSSKASSERLPDIIETCMPSFYSTAQ